MYTPAGESMDDEHQPLLTENNTKSVYRSTDGGRKLSALNTIIILLLHLSVCSSMHESGRSHEAI